MSNILITGGTGFIGGYLIQQLIHRGHQVRVLIRPSKKTPDLPKGLSVEVVVAGFDDPRGLRAAMVDIDTVYHLAGAEWKGAYASLMEIDIAGTRAVVDMAKESGINHLFYLSHLGADRASAYPVMKAKAIAEEYIRRSGLGYTIFRTSIVFGPGDGFTTGLGFILSMLPGIFLMPGDGKTLLQPLWIEDLVTCLVWALEDPKTRNQIFEIGGGEFLSMQQIVEITMETLGKRRMVVNIAAPYLRGITVFFESLLPGFPISIYWLDYLASNRTCAIDTLPRFFHIIPERFTPARLTYLNEIQWGKLLWQNLRREGLFRRIRRVRETA